MNPSETQHESVAIIGLAGRFPGAKNPDEFWRNLRDGVESVSFFKDDELQSSLLDGPPPKDDPNFVKARAVLENSDLFDAAFFNINPREAEIMDPQHRVFLESAWEALENAGYNPDTYSGLIGLFAGASMNTYLFSNLLAHRELTALVGGFQIMLASDKDYLPTRVSYKLNLRGPSLNVQTACSTSLVAVCLACQNLLNYQCDMALAGGVSITFPQKRGLLYQEGGIISPDGHCRTFDANAAGTVSGDGVGIVVLKRLSEALADGDNVRAVIKGCAINNDGSQKIGYTAPGVDGQAEVIAMAQANAGVEPETISYVEAHGTGTPLGDPIEIAALTKAFRAGTAAKGFCAIGSVKSNLGHLDAAAGVAGLIKTVLALQHQQLPPSLHFQRPNPKIDFAESPFEVNDRLRGWKSGGTPRRAGVSSFGIGGTNAHVVLEEAPPLKPSGGSRPLQLLTLSAKTDSALAAAKANLAEHLRAAAQINLADVAFTLHTGRKPFNRRCAVICGNLNDAAVALTAPDAKRFFAGHPVESGPQIAFMFPGQGAQHLNMGRELYETEPVFREHVDHGCELLKPLLELDLRTLLYPGAAETEGASRQLTQTFITQPALFVIEYALAQLWMNWGIRPQAMIGHSIGEYVAACLAGVFSFEDGLALIAARGRLVQKQPPGAMLAVRLSEREVRPLLGRKLSLAAVNGSALCVASGPYDAIEALEKKLVEQGTVCRRLHTSHAFHSEMMEPALHLFTAKVKKAKLCPPQIPYVSNVTGQWITARDATDPNYWAAHLRQTVRFADGIHQLAQGNMAILLEVGPGRTLSTLARQHPSAGTGRTVLSSLRHAQEPESDQASLLSALGRLWVSGVTVDWTGFHAHEQRRRVPLPTYPFERKRHWVAPDKTDASESDTQPAVSGNYSGNGATAEESDGRVATARSDETRPGSCVNQTLADLKVVFNELSGVDLSDARSSATFLELGFDSLFLTQASQAVQKRFGVSVTFRQLLEEFRTLEKLADHLAHRQPEAGSSTGPLPAGNAPRAEHSPPLPGGRTDATAAAAKTVPLTDAQREIWFAAQMGPAVSAAYNESCALQLRGSLQLEVLRRAIDHLTERHEALRASFAPTGDVQKIADSVRIEVSPVDFSDLDERNHNACVSELVHSAVRREFDLVKGPLLRATIARLAPDRHVLVFTAHHIICDGWSMTALLYELGELYSAGCRHASDTLPAPASFSGYALRETARHESPEFTAAEAYWLEQFADSVPVLELPSDRPRPAARTFEGAHCARALGPDLALALKRFSAARGCTTFTTLLAAFNALLHRLSGQDDIVVGVPAAGQIMDGAQHLVGHCANLLPIRSRFDPRQKFGDCLSALKRTVLDAFDHHQYPFSGLIRRLNLPRDPNRVPLANVTFNVGRARGRLNFEGLVVQVARNPKGFVNFDINFNVTETDDALLLDCYYSRELFDDATMARLMSQFEKLLETAIEDPEQQLLALPLLSEDERHRLLVEWNDTTTGHRCDVCIHELFEAQTARTPDAPALVCGTQRLSYGELNQRANQLARQLHDLGVGRESLVGICAERSPAMVVGLLAILKAGGAYVPLDPAYPNDRLAFILEDTRAAVLLTQQPLLSGLKLEIPALKIVALDAQAGPHERRPNASQWPAATTDNLAYVIYTSGSTGKPKGVAIEHRSTVAFIHWAMSVFSPAELAGVLASTSICFDLSVFELFVPLSCGGTVILADNALQLPTLPARREVTLINTVPSAITELLRTGGIPDSVRTVNLAGEPLPIRLARQLYTVGTIQKVYDLYGPSEDTTYSTFALRSPNGPATIGRPIANTQVYILDDHQQPAPVGVPGELCLGGDGLARGYLNRPALTAEKFIPHPFAGQPGARLYKTGDRARYLADGNIEFLGRLDHQVKVRGFRIEPGEIQSSLGLHSAVADCLVIAREDTPGDKRLVAYVILKPHSQINLSELRDFLKKKLPDYMVPSSFVPLDKMPLTPNGKVDRAALPLPNLTRQDSGKNYTAPRTTTEETLVAIWKSVLGLDKVGVDDSFFDLGGHSLLVTQVLTRVREAFQVELPMRRFFETPTIAELADAVEDALVLEIRELSDEEAGHRAGAAELVEKGGP
ncbi:MAG TPA: amino acid adenylation domain-containing protein [Candidatus Angelobacter sp.]|nr:amino acid adenylation domain-containing protein [Candidatus Angelobacter sp.]